MSVLDGIDRSRLTALLRGLAMVVAVVLMPGRAVAQVNIFDEYWPKPDEGPAVVEVRTLDDGLRVEVSEYGPNTQFGHVPTSSVVAGGSLVMAAIG